MVRPRGLEPPHDFVMLLLNKIGGSLEYLLGKQFSLNHIS